MKSRKTVLRMDMGLMVAIVVVTILVLSVLPFLSAVLGSMTVSEALIVLGQNGYVAYANPVGDLIVTGDIDVTGDINGATGRGATIVVATADSSALSQSQADQLGDGTADNIQIQAALDAVTALGGGTVLVMEGTYEITAVLEVGDNTILAGMGWNTILENHRGAGAQPIVVTNDDWVGSTSNIVIRDLAIHGRNEGLGGASGGLLYLCKVTGGLVENVYAHNANHQPFEITRSQDIVVRDCKGDVSNSDDIFSVTDYNSPGGASNVSESTNILFENCVASNSFATGSSFEVDDGPVNVTFKNCWSEDGIGYNVHAHAGEIPPRNIKFIDSGGVNILGAVYQITGSDDHLQYTRGIEIIRPKTIGGGISVRDSLGTRIIDPSISNPNTGGNIINYYGITASRQFSGLHIQGGNISNTGYHGIWIVQDAGYVNDNIEISDVTLGNTTREMIFVDANGGTLTGLRITDNSIAEAPIVSAQAIFVDVDGATITIDRIDDNYILDPAAGLGKGIRIDRDAGTAAINSIEGNTIVGTTTAVSVEGTWTTGKIQFNTGWATESWGISTGTGGQQTIAHGLAAKPTYVNGWGNATDANVFQSAIADTTNIYLTADNGEGYSWEALVR